MTEGDVNRYVVVGVTRKQPDILLQQAARFSRQFAATMICAHVDAGSYVVEERPDGSVTSRPIDPDLPQWDATVFDEELADHIHAVAKAEQVQVTFRELAGDISSALGRLAEVFQAEMIIVGSRSGFRSNMREFFGGSVAVHLIHRQPRPVVVIPLSPVPAGGRLPWEPGS